MATINLSWLLAELLSEKFKSVGQILPVAGSSLVQYPQSAVHTIPLPNPLDQPSIRSLT